MTHFICTTCGVQFAERLTPPTSCPICEDERQFVNPNGQSWTTIDTLRSSHSLRLEDYEPNLVAVVMEPSLAIGQRPLLVRSPGGNVLWDCTPLIDDQTVRAIQALGGIGAIAISHPHFYASMVEWSHAFGGVPVHLPSADRDFVMHDDPVLRFWDGDGLDLWDGIRVVRCGGHFTGSSVLHWPAGADGSGAILTGDTIGVAADRRWVTFMRSYPNEIPLGPSALGGIERSLDPLSFDRIYSAWPGDVVARNAKDAVFRSIARYRQAIATG